MRKLIWIAGLLILGGLVFASKHNHPLPPPATLATTDYQLGMLINAKLLHALRVEMRKQGMVQMEDQLGEITIDIAFHPQTTGQWAVALRWQIYDKDSVYLGYVWQANTLPYKPYVDDPAWEGAVTASFEGLKKLLASREKKLSRET